MDYTTIRTIRYNKSYQAGSVTGSLVEVIGEEIIQDEATGEHYDCFLYNIVGYTPKNGRPFIARKENIIPLEPIEEEKKAIEMGDPNTPDRDWWRLYNTY